MKTVDLEDLREDLAGLVDSATAGNIVIIRRDGIEVARMFPASKQTKAVRGADPSTVAMPDFLGRMKRYFPDGPMPGDYGSTLLMEMRRDYQA